ncbi:MAG: hypothetical protein F6K44_01010 [Moorea sp. SIO3E2]|nr:hypothetical protein [Moorena sp. SIO3E2]
MEIIGQIVTKNNVIGTVVREAENNSVDVNWWWSSEWTDADHLEREYLKDIKFIGCCDQRPFLCFPPAYSRQVGTLYKFTIFREVQKGTIEYPKVDSDRDINNINHWYWGLNIKIFLKGKWVSRSYGVKRNLVQEVRRAQKCNKNYLYIVEQILGKKIHINA